ncbi:MAG: molybdopterin-binding protein [Eggerthella lenta]
MEDTKEALAAAVSAAADAYDFVVTSGGASNGDFDFIKPVVSELGELLMTTVNIRPGKLRRSASCAARLFGLPGNPAAAYVGFEMIIRPALRKMQGMRIRAPVGDGEAIARREEEGPAPHLPARHAVQER